MTTLVSLLGGAAASITQNARFLTLHTVPSARRLTRPSHPGPRTMRMDPSLATASTCSHSQRTPTSTPRP